AVRIEGEEVGTPLFGVPGCTEWPRGDPGLQATFDQRLREHVERNVRSGADREQQPLAVGRESDVARPVVNPRDPLDDLLGTGGRFQVAAAVRKADDAVAVGDID